MSRDTLKSVCKLINQVSSDVLPEKAFLSDLKRSIELTETRAAKKPSQTYKPSSMNCIRNMYYQIIGAEQDADSENYCLIGICNSGSDIHVRMQKYIEGMKLNGIDCEYIDVADYVSSRNLDYLTILSKSGMETKLYHKDLNMTFLCDGIIRYKNHYYILELKTEASFKWSSRAGVDPSHYNQATAYSISFKLPEVMFVYINRDVMDMKAYLFKPTDDMKQDLLGKISDCDGYVNRQICPPKPNDVAKKTCTYCSYRTRCEGES